MQRLMILAAAVALTGALAGAPQAYASGSHDATKTESGEAATTGSGGDEATSEGTEATSAEHRTGPMILMPIMSPERGRKVYARKGCVVCHAINGIGGEDAPSLAASDMESPMNPFDFAAKMWRGAQAMIMMQEDELGQQVEFTGQELADLIAFVHDADEQKKFSDDDIPENVEKKLHAGD